MRTRYEDRRKKDKVRRTQFSQCPVPSAAQHAHASERFCLHWLAEAWQACQQHGTEALKSRKIKFHCIVWRRNGRGGWTWKQAAMSGPNSFVVHVLGFTAMSGGSGSARWQERWPPSSQST